MRIYLAHRRTTDFKKTLYEPLREAFGAVHELIFPYENGDEFDARKAIPTCDLVLAEVSAPSTSVGIEIGWASSEHIRLIAIHKESADISGAVPKIVDSVIVYKDSKDLIEQLTEALK